MSARTRSPRRRWPRVGAAAPLPPPAINRTRRRGNVGYDTGMNEAEGRLESSELLVPRGRIANEGERDHRLARLRADCGPAWSDASAVASVTIAWRRRNSRWAKTDHARA